MRRSSPTFDFLTGLLNRRGLLNYVDEMLAAVSANSIVVCIVFDIDAFKAVNDSRGHAVGDAVLVSTADMLAFAVGVQGVVARTGGEEFMAVSVATPRVADMLLARLPTMVIGDGLPPITISVGAATAPAIRGGAEHVWHAFARADQNMYAAKRAGGGQLVAGDQ